MKPLTKRQINTKLKALAEGWELSKTGTSIARKYNFRSYMAGFMFVTKASVHAQVALHFPEITLTANSVKISLTTKEVKALTEKDFALAQQFDTTYSLSTTNVISVHNHY